MCCGVVETTLTLQHKHRRSSWLMWAQAWSWRLSVHHFGFWLLADFGMAHEGLVSLPSFASFPFFSMFQSSWKVSTVFMSRWLRGKKYLIDLTGALVASGRTSFAASRTEVPNVCDLPLVIFVGAFYRWIVFVSGKKNIEFFVKQFFMFEERMYFLSDSRIARSTSMAFRTCRLAVKREKIPQPLCVFFLVEQPLRWRFVQQNSTGWR